MKKFLLLSLISSFAVFSATGEEVILQNKNYTVEIKADREIGPGIRHTRYRLPQYPLNINVVTVDLNNPYNRIETTVANESAKGTESLVKAAERQSSPGHRAVAGANANFWVVASQPEEKTYTGTTRNASIRNGKMVTESNQHRDQWDGGTMRTGVTSISYDKTAYIDYCTSDITITSEKTGSLQVHQCNKGVWSDELCMYNSFYGSNREFMPIYQDSNGKYQHDQGGDATEVILDLAEGQGWDSGRDIHFIVSEVRANAGKGTLGAHDLALVGRGDNASKIAALAPGDAVTLKYTWTYNPGTADEVTPLVEQAIGGNALVMRGGELTEHNTNETYNSQVYSRTGYGCSADGKTLYIVVIDKSTDPVYGKSAGCNTSVMCEFARSLGCSNMANFDAGGSAEMFVNGKIENRTTEGTPRNVANGWLVYSTAPEDTDDARTVGKIVFDELTFDVPVYGTFEPKVIAYNKYGAVIDYDYKDFTLSCDPELGTCNGTVFSAAGTPVKGKLTASAGDISTTVDIEIKSVQMALRVKPVLIDIFRQYPIEVSAELNGETFTYDPAVINWTVADPSIVSIQNGVLTGLREGSTSYTAEIGDFTDNADVTVEVSKAPEVSLAPWTEWTVKGISGINNCTFDENGTISYTYASPRDPYLTITGAKVLYSLPDAIYLDFNTDVNLRQIQFDVRLHGAKRPSLLYVKPEGKEFFEPGVDHRIAVPLEMVDAPADIAAYPLTLNYVRFFIESNSANKGQHAIRVQDITAHYNNFASSIEKVESADERITAWPNPVSAGSDFTIAGNGISYAAVYSASGMLVSTAQSAAAADNIVLRAPASTGAYIVKVIDASGTSSFTLIVR